MASKKVLVVTYYWPPSGGSGVQRWLKFAKYLPNHEWQPIIFTPENPDFDLKDDSLAQDINTDIEVIRLPIWEPFGIYKKFFAGKKNKNIKPGTAIEKTKKSWKDHLTVWIRGNLFLPDPRRFWIKSAVEFLVPYIKQHDIKVLVTTGPPHSMHLIGQGVRRQCAVKWIADFRDPWAEWDMLDQFKASKIVRLIHKRMERKVLRQADVTLTIGHRLAQHFEDRKAARKIAVVTNGADHEDFKHHAASQPIDKFRISHMGLLNELRNPKRLWRALEELCIAHPDFAEDLEILLASTVSESILEEIRSFEPLSKRLKYVEYLSHQEVLTHYKRSAVLLLLMNQTPKASGFIPAKLFEYLLAQRPILALGHKDSDVQDLLTETHAGEVLSMDDQVGIKERIQRLYQDYKQGKTPQPFKNTDRFHRSQLTKQLATILDSCLE